MRTIRFIEEISCAEFTTVDLLRDIKTIIMASDRLLVAITQRRKPRHVLMTYDEFEAMKERDPRKLYHANEAPKEMVDNILPELEP